MTNRKAKNTPPSATGPRGGTTTVTQSGMVKKNLWIERELAEVLRRTAFELRWSEAEIIRTGLRHVLAHQEELLTEEQRGDKR